jgi:oligopeptide transport system ATP-binding protein
MLHATDVHVRYPLAGGKTLRAVDGVSLVIEPGEIVAVVGESGCGKSTLARALVGLVRMQSGEVYWQGERVDYTDRRSLRRLRSGVQMVFQDPFSSLDPRMTVAESLLEPLGVLPRAERGAAHERVMQMLERVGLGAAFAQRYPHELSGGQCQRVAIARALMAEPKLLICDEAVSALDVSVQAQVVALLQRLQQDLQLSLLFISHHLALVRQLAHRVVVLYLGRVLESGSATELFAWPLHPYTRALIAAVPEPDPAIERARSRVTLRGELPSPVDPPSGCVFRTRCPHAIAVCAERTPVAETADQRVIACHRWRELAS